MNNQRPQISVILPCQNEEGALGMCIDEIRESLTGQSYEIIVSDSSTDRSPEIARQKEAKLVKHDLPGYGNAYLQAFPHAQGDYIVMADADFSYDFKEVKLLINKINEGFDLVIGSRLRGNIYPGAMPFSHRIFGTPILNLLIQLTTGLKISDSQSGFRAITKNSLCKLGPTSPGMEFASEMIVKAKRTGLKINEVPISYRARIGESKLRKIKDGWGHLKFILLCSPDYIFFWAGFILFLVGLSVSIWFLFPPINFFGFTLITHPMFFSGMATILGHNLMTLGFLAKLHKSYTWNQSDQTIYWWEKHAGPGRTLIFGVTITLIGITTLSVVAIKWMVDNFGSIDNPNLSIMSLILITVGIQTIFSTLFISVTEIK